MSIAVKPISKKKLIAINNFKESEILRIVNESISHFSKSLLEGKKVKIPFKGFLDGKSTVEFVIKSFNSTDEWEVTYEDNYLETLELYFKLK